MTKALFPIASLLLSVAILVTGNGLLSTLLPVRASLELFGSVEIGLLGSSYYLGYVLGCLYGGRTIQRVGHIRTFTALASIAAAVTLAHALLLDPMTWAALRAVTGFCFAGLYLVIESWLNKRATNQNRGGVMGLYTMITLSVSIVGQMMLTLGDPASFLLFALASILISLAAVPVALTTALQPAPIARPRLRLMQLYRISPVGVVGVLLAGAATGTFWSLGPAYAIELGADTQETAIFMSVVALGGALTQWPIGRLSDQIDRRIIVIGACTIAALAGGVMVLTSGDRSPAIAALAVIFGAAALPIYALCAAHVFDLVEPSEIVETSSGLLLANGVGAVAGPLMAAFFMREIGPGGLFIATAGTHAVLALFVVWRILSKAPVPKEQRHDFDLATTAPTMVALAPEGTENGAPAEREPEQDAG